jgi:septal ring factor EnvC (AmiA/AmiB activator)
MDENTLRGATGVHHRFRVRDEDGFLGLSSTPVLESAMSVLTDFQTNAARNDLYRSRLDYLRVQNTMADELAQALADTERALADTERALADTARALADTEQALADTEQALAREAQLRERLRAAGIDPDSG